MFVMATAGHVDHGKSALVEALTGTHPDRLAEEQARGMTIDLGFAYFTLPSGREVAIVDVPGHQRFIHNMLAGVGGIHGALFVVAAPDGWMPQSQEHLAILDLLGVTCGVVAVTKVDLVEEPDWLDLVVQDIRHRLAVTGLRQAPVVPVSSVTRLGLAELVAQLDRCLAAAPQAPDYGRPRLWIDRAFSVRGAGPVVTGTLVGGRLQVDQWVTILPDAGGRELSARIRALQSHHRPVRVALPGTRVAVNLTGVEVGQLGRGQALVDAAAGPQALSRHPLALVRLLPDAPGALGTGGTVRCHAGSAQCQAQVRLLGATEVKPGQEAMAQLRLARALPLRWQDRLVLRDPGRQATLGVALVADPLPPLLHGTLRVRCLPAPARRPAARTLLGNPTPVVDEPARRLRPLAGAELTGALEALINLEGALDRESALRRLLATAAQLEAAGTALARAGSVVALPGHWVATGAWERLERRLGDELATYHRAHPLAPGLPRQTAASTLGLPSGLFDEVVAELACRGQLVADAGVLRHPQHRIVLQTEHRVAAGRLVELLERHGFSPPPMAQLVGREGFDPELVARLIEEGTLIRVHQDFLFTPAQIRHLQAVVSRLAAGSPGGVVDPGKVRDVLGTTRRFVIPLLEYLDRVGFTRWDGSRRVLAGRVPPAANTDGC